MKVHNPTKFQVSLKILLKNDKDEYLLLKDNSSNKNWTDKWDLPGGRINDDEIDEPFHKLVQREVTEEAGKDVTYELRPDPVALAKCQYENEPPKMFVLFEAKYKGGEIVYSEEHNDYTWTKLNKNSNLDELFSSVLSRLMKNYFDWN